MQAIPSKRQEILKRISGSHNILKPLPSQPPRRTHNKIQRHSKWDDLPKIPDKKSFRSVPTTLQITLLKHDRSTSKELLDLHDRRLKNIGQSCGVALKSRRLLCQRSSQRIL